MMWTTQSPVVWIVMISVEHACPLYDIAGNKGWSGHEDRQCSMHFLKAPLPWMLSSPATLRTPTDHAEGVSPPTDHAEVVSPPAMLTDRVEESLTGQRIPSQGPGSVTLAQMQQEGRLACPCCGAKLGKFDMVDGLACSCGVEVRVFYLDRSGTGR